MRDELSKKLIDAYPGIFSDAIGTPFHLFGFEIADGWYKVVDALCAEMTRIAERDAVPLPRATQVKEKFGTLRFYAVGLTEAMADAVDAAEQLSATTCETCGNPGSIVDDLGWMIASCATCLVARIEKRKKDGTL